MRMRRTKALQKTGWFLLHILVSGFVSPEITQYLVLAFLVLCPVCVVLDLLDNGDDDNDRKKPQIAADWVMARPQPVPVG